MYGVAGRHQRGAEVFCANIENGELAWRDRLKWNTQLMNRQIELEFFRGSLLGVRDYFIGLSELGSLALFTMNPKGFKILDAKQLFFSPGTWTLPALSKGLLYIMQNEKDRSSGKGARILCYDLRGN